MHCTSSKAIHLHLPEVPRNYSSACADKVTLSSLRQKNVQPRQYDGKISQILSIPNDFISN